MRYSPLAPTGLLVHPPARFALPQESRMTRLVGKTSMASSVVDQGWFHARRPATSPGRRQILQAGLAGFSSLSLGGLLRERAGKGNAWILPLPKEDIVLLAGHDEATGWLLVHGNREWAL